MAGDMGMVFMPSALPLEVGLDGEVVPVGMYKLNILVCSDDEDIFDYLLRIATRYMHFRVFQDDRLTCFELKQKASCLLYRFVLACREDAELEM